MRCAALLSAGRPPCLVHPGRAVGTNWYCICRNACVSDLDVAHSGTLEKTGGTAAVPHAAADGMDKCAGAP